MMLNDVINGGDVFELNNYRPSYYKYDLKIVRAGMNRWVEENGLLVDNNNIYIHTK